MDYGGMMTATLESRAVERQITPKAMAIDHGRQGIRVNCICPGDVDTPMLPEDARLRGLNWDKYLAGCANRFQRDDCAGRISTLGLRGRIFGPTDEQ